jgi:ATP-binding cassette, subfamily F, member 3
MISISFANVSLTLGARSIFKNLTWEIQHDQKIGLIGPNGAGKSSLLKLITGEYTPEPGGTLARMRGVTIGYLPQQPELDPGGTVWAAALAGNPRPAAIQTELERVEASFADPAVYAHPPSLGRAIARQQALLEEYDIYGGDQYPLRVKDLLLGLGLAEPDFAKTIGTLSGGQKKLVGLARLILEKPDVLLLDEPDNHLDLAGKAYLEGIIQSYPGAVVIVSHDRYLLDRVVSHIAEIEDGRLTTFSGDYSTYILEKEIRLARQEELYQVQQREINRIETAMKRYALWAKVYDNEKFAKRAHSIEKRLEKIDRIDRPVTERRRMGLQLEGWRGSSKVLELTDVRKSFNGRGIINGIDLILRHGERVGLIGSNGSGKSVLFRLLMGILSLDRGEIQFGPSIRTGYYAQEHETLDPEQTLIETIRYAGEMNESNAVAFLRRYLFTYKQASQKVKELSGGERSRLQLALLVLSSANCLLMDEPTNNLDIASAEVLENALNDFEGTVLVISHDRYFLDRVVDRVLVLENGKLTNHPGGYSDYLARMIKP